MSDWPDADAAGYAIVPNTGTGAEVKYGAREINRTRNYVAIAWNKIKTKANARATAGLLSGTSVPANTLGADGDWYAQIL